MYLYENKQQRLIYSANCSLVLLFSFLYKELDIAKNDYYFPRVCLSVRMKQIGSHWTDFDEI